MQRTNNSAAPRIRLRPRVLVLVGARVSSRLAVFPPSLLPPSAARSPNDSAMADPISIAASVVSLVTQTQHVIKAVSGLRTSSVCGGRLDRLLLFQKIISRSADVLPQALDDELFFQHHQEIMQLCLAQCARLISQLEDNIPKVTKNSFRSVIFERIIVEALEQLETWSKLLSEEMNQSVRPLPHPPLVADERDGKWLSSIKWLERLFTTRIIWDK